MNIKFTEFFRPLGSTVIFAKCYEQDDFIIGMPIADGMGIRFAKESVEEVVQDGYEWLTVDDFVEKYS